MRYYKDFDTFIIQIYNIYLLEYPHGSRNRKTDLREWAT